MENQTEITLGIKKASLVLEELSFLLERINEKVNFEEKFKNEKKH